MLLAEEDDHDEAGHAGALYGQLKEAAVQGDRLLVKLDGGMIREPRKQRVVSEAIHQKHSCCHTGQQERHGPGDLVNDGFVGHMCRGAAVRRDGVRVRVSKTWRMPPPTW